MTPRAKCESAPRRPSSVTASSFRSCRRRCAPARRRSSHREFEQPRFPRHTRNALRVDRPNKRKSPQIPGHTALPLASPNSSAGTFPGAYSAARSSGCKCYCIERAFLRRPVEACLTRWGQAQEPARLLAERRPAALLMALPSLQLTARKRRRSFSSTPWPPARRTAENPRPPSTEHSSA
jgi:hypothetical protein